MDNEKRKQTIKFFIAISVLVIIVLIVISLIVKYQVEGEKNLPFKLSKIIMKTTAEAIENEKKDTQEWNISIYQNNELCNISLSKIRRGLDEKYKRKFYKK